MGYSPMEMQILWKAIPQSHFPIRSFTEKPSIAYIARFHLVKNARAG